MKLKLLMPLLALTIAGCASNFYYEEGEKIEVIQLKEKRSSIDNVTYYKTSKGYKVGVNNEILLQCVEATDCKEILSKYALISITSLSDKILLVKVSEDENVFEMSQKLYEDKSIEFAHPNFIKVRKRR